MRLSLSPFAVRRSARLAGRPAADLTGHPVVLDGEDAPGLDAHALEEEDGVLFAAGANAAREEPDPQPAPSARELAAAEAARARLYGGGEAAAGPSGAELPLLSGPPPPAVDVPLLATADLLPLDGDDVAATLAPALAALAASPTGGGDWVCLSRALETLRRGVAHHAGSVPADALRPALAGVVASMLSLRSALCRAGLAAAADLVAAYGRSHPWVVLGEDEEGGDSAAHPSPSPCLLPPLVTKAGATDKRFVVDAAAAALACAASGAVPAAPLAAALLPHTTAKNPRVRAAAGTALALAARRMNGSGGGRGEAPWPEATTAAALAAGAALTSDAWPAARIAGRDLTAALLAGREAGGAAGAENLGPVAVVDGGEGAGAKDAVVTGAPAPAPPAPPSAHRAAVLGERGAAALV